MKWIYFEHNQKLSYGRLVGEQVERVELTWADILVGETAVTLETIPLDKVRLKNPIQAPGKIVCIGLNYLDHCRETGIDVPTPLNLYQLPDSSQPSQCTHHLVRRSYPTGGF